MSLPNSNQTHQFNVKGYWGVIQMSEKTWWKSLIAYLYAVLVTLLCFAVVLEGNGMMYIAGTIMVGMLCILLIFGVDVQYVKLGTFEIRFQDAQAPVTFDYKDNERESEAETNERW